MPLMTNTQYAQHRGCSVAYIGQLIKKGKIPDSAMVDQTGGKPLIDSLKADRALEKTRSHTNRRDKKGKVNNGSPRDKESKEAIAFFKKLGIDVENLPSHADLQRLKIFYEAQEIRRKHEMELGKYILAELVEKRAYAAGKQIKEQCLAIADRCAPLVAACSDQFECKQILLQEINYILEGLSQALEVKP